MANVTTRESYLRRQLIKRLWISGVRSISKLAEKAGTSCFTVKRDLIFIRQELRSKINNEKLELIRQEEDLGLLQDIEQINEIIEKILANQEKKTEVVVKDEKPVEKKQAIHPTDYNAIVGLIGKKLQARQQRAELWGLISNKLHIGDIVGGDKKEIKQYVNISDGELKERINKQVAIARDLQQRVNSGFSN